MAGTKSGGLAAAETNKKKYGESFYVEIGRKGGSKKVSKGFGVDRERARLAGQKGGTISRKPKKLTKEAKAKYNYKEDTDINVRDYLFGRHS